ncbi:monovalent cation/H+ antiporter subunit A [Hyphomicrobium sulfonivorans]|uniref:monovalent cation/H+ antiporter subunit A n=1 Tax=Hyphomicrobium sulfonivorans TaxID=121290 RepID=UPI00156F4B65|nr:monovalent cation/H+ antiporter subunit A [Hyphomicrobium sulfonivorans]MBI1650309.1 monovalent cation/H+ antiporter subunit A [Hyphomicrobium sulfonivorans]NSL72328.1 monovalent cation/H+ antiporter subunit A [Hyphomicrobium sulfonivorans]
MISNESLLLAAIAIPFLGSLVAALLPTNARNLEAWLAGTVALAEIGIFSVLYPAITDGQVVRSEWAWMPTAGLNFVLRIDGLSWIFALLIAGIGGLVFLYARYYMSPQDPVPRFFSFLLAFMGSMLGIVFSGNLIQLVFFWELTSVFSFLLIAYWHHDAGARSGARLALTITAAGGLCLFGGVLVLGEIVGSYDLDEVLASGVLIRSHDLYLPALVLILLGAFTKSAQFPFHVWLPRAMAAPTPVSAYLHSATMVKAGIFLLIRLWPVLSGTEAWLWLVATTGLITFVTGAYLAMFQNDLKGVLAYSTISHLGLTTLLLGMDAPLATVAAIFHVMNHATFKASLFMAAGVIDHETGTRDIRKLSGLYRYMPVTTALATVAAAAMAGVPLLNGFLSKEMFFAETIETHDGSLMDTLLPYFATVAAAFSVAYSLRFIRDVFFGPPPTDLPREPHEPPHWMRFPIELLVVVCLLVGMFPNYTIGPFLNVAVASVLGGTAPKFNLAIWHGFTLPFVMSIVAMAGGIAVYAFLKLYNFDSRKIPWPAIGDYIPTDFAGTTARSVMRWIGTRSLQPQLRSVVCFAFVAGLAPLVGRTLFPETLQLTKIDAAFALVWIIGVVCALATAYQAKFHRLAALIFMSGAGIATFLTFIYLSAPDLALTQLLVEVVTTVLILLGLRWLPKRDERLLKTDSSMLMRRYVDLTIAMVVGTGLAMLAFAVMTRPAPQYNLAEFFLHRSYAEGGGRNVVNVILVDFRGFDTLGEITVLCIVALVVFALLRRFRPSPESIGSPEQKRIQEAFDVDHPDRRPGETIADYLLIPSVIMRLLFPVIGTLGIYLFLRGHDLPGGGFVAGLTLAIAIILQYMGGGAAWVEDRIRVFPLRWMAVGFAFALAGGGIALAFGYPFLTAFAYDLHLPVIGSLHLSTVLLFDLGVLAIVLGATVLIIIALAHQSIRTHRKPKATAAEEAA